MSDVINMYLHISACIAYVCVLANVCLSRVRALVVNRIETKFTTCTLSEFDILRVLIDATNAK